MTKRQIRWVLLLWLPVGGCGGHYTLTVPDHVAAVGSEAPMVVRLQRNDFFVLDLPVPDALMRMRIGDGIERAAYTDKLGYAGTTVPAPKLGGRYPLRVDHMDHEGEEISSAARVFVWDPKQEAIAIDADSLPPPGREEAQAARLALEHLAGRANLAYFTRKDVHDHAKLRERLTEAGYPDGAILLWQRERWHIVRNGRFRLPRVVVESRLVSQLSELRKDFPDLSVGVCASELAAKAFAAAEMQVVVVGDTPVDVPNRQRRDSWADLARRGI
jgi:hypothetical protein